MIVNLRITFESLSTTFEVSTNVFYNTSLLTNFCHRYSLIHALNTEIISKIPSSHNKATRHTHTLVQPKIMNSTFWMLM